MSSGESVLVGSFMVTLGTDGAELLVLTDRPEGELITGSRSSADRTGGLVLLHNGSVSVIAPCRNLNFSVNSVWVHLITDRIPI